MCICIIAHLNACLGSLSTFQIGLAHRKSGRHARLLVGTCEVYVLFGFTIYLMHLADYLKHKKSKKEERRSRLKCL